MRSWLLIIIEEVYVKQVAHILLFSYNEYNIKESKSVVEENFTYTVLLKLLNIIQPFEAS